MADVSIRNATKRVNSREQSCSTRSCTRPHVHWRTRESKPTTPYITLQWQLGNFSCHILLQNIA